MTPAASSPSSPVRSSSSSATASLDDLCAIVGQFIDSRRDWLIEFRRRIHAKPEPSGAEFATTQLVADTLREHGLQPRIMRDGLGVIVDIDLGAPGNSFVALRAELDCVKVDDDKQVPYASKNPGLCHACGHDAHTTIVLATALALHENGSRLRALGLALNLRIIFQPAEENATGARSMIEQGALANVAAILAVHVEPSLDAGVIGLRKGPLTSACTAFEVTIKGRSGHSARPFEAIDPIPAATNIVDLFYQLCPRSMDSRYPLALSVTTISSGGSFNVIPDDATIKGTLRAARLEDINAVKQRMAAVVQGAAQATGCEISLAYPFHAPPTNNDPKLIDIMADAAAHMAPGMPGAKWFDVPSLGAEDFAFYQEVIPGAIVRLGTAHPLPPGEGRSEGASGNMRGLVRHPLHSSLFDIDESALTIGAKFLARSALTAAQRI